MTIQALRTIADAIDQVADAMEEEEAVLRRHLVGLSWRGLAAEAVRGVLRRHACTLEDARRRHRLAAGEIRAHRAFLEDLL